MRRTNLFRTCAIVLCLLAMPRPTYAQDSPSSTPAPIPAVDSAELSAAELNRVRAALAELAGRRAEVAALKDVAKAKDAEIATLKSILDSQERLIGKWREAAEARAGANALEDEIRRQYDELTRRYDAEISRLREQRDSAIRAGRRNAVIGFVLGVGVTLAIVFGRNGG